MDKDFLNHSKEIANNFIQNVVFVDDRAYLTEKAAQDFDAPKVMETFANEGKLCAIYTPSTIGNEETFSVVLNKADAVVLDWDMRSYTEIEFKDKDSNPNDDEEDEEIEDPRGEFACNLIRNIAKDTTGIKVILIYTGDKRVHEICEKVKECIDNAQYDEQSLSVITDRIIVAVRAKDEDSEEQFKHNPKLKEFIISYEYLPQCIIEQYIRLTNGLIPNFALKALTAIRDHTPKILSVFSKDLDMGYLVHKASMEFPEDAKYLLIHLFGDALADLLKNVLSDTQTWADTWVDTYITNQKKTIHGVDINRTKELIKQLLQPNSTPTSNYTSRLAQKLLESQPQLSKSQRSKLESPAADLSQLFEIDMQNIEESNKKFAILTHHKNVFLPLSSEPTLSLGTIILDKSGTYFVCIQQRCDSVRIKGERRFLFLPLEVDGKNPILITNGLKLCPNKDSFAIIVKKKWFENFPIEN